MRNRCLLLALLLGLGFAVLTQMRQTASANNNDEERVNKLVQQLGSSKFSDRDKAKRELESLGMKALEGLRKAAKNGDLETSRRASELLKKLEDKIATDSILAPKKVKLSFKDTSVLDAVAELSRQSGYQIQVQGDRTALAKRTVTLTTGEISFWEAFDQLCQKAGLVEMNAQTGGGFDPVVPLPQPLPNPIKIRPNIKIQPLPAPGVLPVVPPAQNNNLPGVLDALKKALENMPQGQPAPGQNDVPAALEALKKAIENGNGRPVVAPMPVQIQGIPVQIEVPVQIPGAAGGAGGAGGQPGQAGQPGQPGQAAPAVKPLPAQIQPMPVQVQVQPIQIQPGRRPAPRPNLPPNQIHVMDGKPVQVPTCYSGAVRIRVLPANQPRQIGVQPAQAGEVLLILEVTAEPRLQNFVILGARAQKAVDDQGQQLTIAMEPMPNVNPNGVVNGGFAGAPAPFVRYGSLQQQVALRLKLGDKKAKSLTELTGTISAQTLSPPEALITVDNVLKSAGKTVKGKNGGAIEVQSIEKQADGDYRVKIRLENPPNVNAINGPGVFQIMPANGVQIQGQIQIGGAQIGGRPGLVNNSGLPTLVDDKGQSYELVQIPARGFRGVNGVFSQEVTLVFRAANGVGAPARMVLNGHRMVDVQVPFTLKDVPLP
jgi:hypothetical protein